MELLTKASFSNEVTERELRNLSVAYRAACESMVLLKNDGALPFPEYSEQSLGCPGLFPCSCGILDRHKR